MLVNNWQRGEFEVTTDKDRLDLNTTHEFLAQSSEWARGIPRSTFEKSLRHSLCFGLFNKKTQIGFARVISDHATIAYLGDVFVLPEYRGRGLAKWLMECVLSHPELQMLRRWILVTKDAHRLYRQFSFTPLASPLKFMELYNPDIYKQPNPRQGELPADPGQTKSGL